MTVSGILNEYPESFAVVSQMSTLKNWYARLGTTVAQRLLAERAAVPICSKYAQALIELLSAMRKSCTIVENLGTKQPSFERISVDASTPSPLKTEDADISSSTGTTSRCWEWEENWISNDSSWEVWTGTVECLAVDWDTPSRSAVRSLMDGGDGPPMLQEGCTVVRGLDWDDPGTGIPKGNEDGKDIYDKEKALSAAEKSSTDTELKESNECDADTKVRADREKTGNSVDEKIVPKKTLQLISQMKILTQKKYLILNRLDKKMVKHHHLKVRKREGYQAQNFPLGLSLLSNHGMGCPILDVVSLGA